MNRAQASATGGFTLLEVLVTMVIMALLVTLLTQALQQSLRMRERMQQHQRSTRVESLQEQWFRDTVGSTVADLPDALGLFGGDAESIDLLTSAPLDAMGLQRIQWTLKSVDGGVALHYTGNSWPETVVIRGPLRDAKFHYLDEEGKWLQEWSPEAGDKFVLPRAVRFEAETDAGRLSWLVPIIVEREVPKFMRLKEMGIGM